MARAESLALRDATRHATLQVPILSAGECEAKLATFLSPLYEIRQGLSAIDALGAPTARAATIECLGKIFPQWQTAFPDTTPFPSARAELTDTYYASARSALDPVATKALRNAVDLFWAVNGFKASSYEEAPAAHTDPYLFLFLADPKNATSLNLSVALRAAAPVSNDHAVRSASAATGAFCEGCVRFRDPSKSPDDPRYFLTDEQVAAARAKTLSEIRKAVPAAKFRAWKAAYQKKETAEEAARLVATRAYEPLYEARRVLARYLGYLKTSPSGSPRAFCEEMSATDRKEADYFRLVAAAISTGTYFDDRYWKLAEDYGLSDAEASALADYASTYYGVINPILRKHAPLTPTQAIWLKTAQAAFARLPVYDSSPLYRGESPFPSSDYHVGGEVQFDGFTSTTSDRSTFHTSAFGPVHLMLYPAASARDISFLNPYEREVTLLPGAKFKVLAKRPADADCKVACDLVLAETDADGNITAKVPAEILADPAKAFP